MKTLPMYAGLAALAVAAVSLPAVAANSMGSMMAAHATVVQIKPLNGSGESGTATLTDTKAGLKVVVAITGAPADAQPAHIHKGSCAKLDPKPWYPLSNVVGGKSTTVVKGVTIAQIAGKSAINVHKSTTDIATYVACGDVAKSSAMKM
ncbi:MAG TPA: hypothetical protein VGN14_17500 [Candidatus Elarobacter sp.]|jgi:hypothetical protein